MHPNGNVNPCCTAMDITYGNTNDMTVEDAWKSDTAKKFRQDLLDGIPQKACSFCYNQEKFNNGSLRTRLNRSYGDQISNNIEPDFALRYLDIRSSNICNMACVMCSHSLSSSWYEDGLSLNYGVQPESSKFIMLSNNTEQDILKIIDNKLEIVYFAGGEPLITPYHYTLIESLIDRGISNNIRLEYNTNLSALKYKKFKILDLWKQFKSVQIRASIDASDEIAEYQRYGTDWKKIAKNWNIISKQMPEIDIAPQITVTTLNIRHLPKFLDLLVDEFEVNPFHHVKANRRFTVNLAQQPKRFSCVNLPNDIKAQYTSEIEHYKRKLRPDDERIIVLEMCLSYMNSQEPEIDHFTDGLKFLSNLDNLRSTNWKSLWPEFMEYYNEES